MHKAVFMDRDGTVSEEIGYMYDAGLYKPYAYAGPAIRRINESGMKAVLVTNQSGIGRGYFEESMVHQVHDILQAEKDLDIDLTESYVVGDKQIDVETAYAAGAKSVLVLTGYGRNQREIF